MKAVLIPAVGQPSVIELADDLETHGRQLHDHVGGFFERVRISGLFSPEDQNRTRLYVDEDGLAKNRPVNLMATMYSSLYAGTNIVGDSVMCGEQGEDLCDVSEAVIELVTR